METTTTSIDKEAPPVTMGNPWLSASFRKLYEVIAANAYWTFSVFIFISCQQNLTQINHGSASFISQQIEAPVEKVIALDTSDILNRVTFFNSKMAESKLIDFYHRNSLTTKWLNPTAPTALYFSFIDHLKKAEYFGLNPEAYNIGQLEQMVSEIYQHDAAEDETIINADVLITETFLVFASHLSKGRIVDPGHGNKIWIKPVVPVDDLDVSLLLSTKDAKDLGETIAKLQPANQQYINLQKMLMAYRILSQSEPEGNRLSIRTRIKPGDHHSTIPSIRKRLKFLTVGPISADSVMNDSLHYDAALELAVKQFQQQHGLEPDGVIGDKTVTWMNMSFREKADLIAINMERMRWMPAISSTPAVHVNIPEYKLRIYEQGKVALQMNVIVGAVSNATPVFSSALESIVFSPTWTVPSKIIKEEFVPRLKKDKAYYADRKSFTFYKNGTEIDPSVEPWDSTLNVRDYRIVQKPGPDNALGLVKFIIRNNMNIYLHDTPDHRSFAKYYRALSHGCIRLDEPTQFAAYLLQDNSAWDVKRIKKAMASGQTENSVLAKHCPVHLQYNTVWVDESGFLNFREDIYGHDESQLRSLYPNRVSSNLVARAGG